jgi:nitric oxide reductase large subunit
MLRFTVEKNVRVLSQEISAHTHRVTQKSATVLENDAMLSSPLKISNFSNAMYHKNVNIFYNMTEHEVYIKYTHKIPFSEFWQLCLLITGANIRDMVKKKKQD